MSTIDAKLRVAASMFLLLAWCGCVSDSANDAHPSEITAHTTVPLWSYSGDSGPEHWGDIDQTYDACQHGLMQSPIDLGTAQASADDFALYDYAPSHLHVINNGRTIRAQYDAGSTMQYDGVTYPLIQFHFHVPSEHSIHGISTAMELHLVHDDGHGNTVVAAVLLNAGDTTPPWDALWSEMPSGVGDYENGNAWVDASQLLPEDRHAYRYTGSLTTPPCTENVHWIVFKQIALLPAARIELFQRIIGNNARPTQPLNNRIVRVDE